jgi:hypothetical protein
MDWLPVFAYDMRRSERVRASRYFLFAFGACPPCGLAAAVCFTALATGAVGDGVILWAFAILIGVPAGLAGLVGNRSRLTGQQIAAGTIGAGGIVLAEAFVLLLVALSHANLTTPML